MVQNCAIIQVIILPLTTVLRASSERSFDDVNIVPHANPLRAECCFYLVCIDYQSMVRTTDVALRFIYQFVV